MRFKEFITEADGKRNGVRISYLQQLGDQVDASGYFHYHPAGTLTLAGQWESDTIGQDTHHRMRHFLDKCNRGIGEQRYNQARIDNDFNIMSDHLRDKGIQHEISHDEAGRRTIYVPKDQ